MSRDGTIDRKMFMPRFATRRAAAQPAENRASEPTPEELRARLERNQALAREFKSRAEQIHASFSILLYGSTAYGYNGKGQSALDDIDMALVIPQELSAEKFLEQARYVFGPELRVQMPYLEGLLKGDWDLCRMYGNNGDTKLEFWIMRTNTFRYLQTDKGSKQPVRDIANPNFKILTEQNWSIEHWKSIPVQFEHEEFTDKDGNKHLKINNYFFSHNGRVLGSLGSRLLQAESLYDPSGTSQLDTKALTSFWFNYVRACLAAHPHLTNDQIINSIERSERFSDEYRARLSKLIDQIRLSLSMK